LHYQERM